MEMSHKNASFGSQSTSAAAFVSPGFLFIFLFFIDLFIFCYVEKLLTLTLETLGSKEVATWLVWLQNTKEHG